MTLDDGIIPSRLAAQRVVDPDLLLPHLFEGADPGFAARFAPGDIVLAGRNFASGKPRVQGFIAMAAARLGIVCLSMPYKMLRRAVARAIPVITGAPPAALLAATGDQVEVDFAAGVFVNRSRNLTVQLPPMPEGLRDLVAGGGMEAVLRDWLARHPEQAATGDRPPRTEN